MKKKCIFLDRDGNINVEKDYLHKAEDFEFEYKADQAIKILTDKGYLLIVVTNQSGVARGYYKESDVIKLHKYVDTKIEELGGKIAAYYYCPHHPEKGVGKYKVECDCRKPQIGMFLKADKEFDIDFENSFIVGDKVSDLEVAVRLGMQPVLVKTGHGLDEVDKIYFHAKIYNNLYEFAQSIKPV